MIITSKNCLIPACEGADHKWEFERPTIRELKRIETVTGLDIGDFFEGLGDVETTGVTSKALDAILALVDILHRRDGLRPEFEDVDVDFPNFGIEFQPGEVDEDEEPEDEAGKGPAPVATSHPPAAPDATGPGSGPESAAESTPSSSPTPPASGGGTDSP